jgi:DNA-binding HxlR family transcriptional regulator
MTPTDTGSRAAADLRADGGAHADRDLQAADVFRASCPSRQVLDLVADKWSVLVVAAVAQGVGRNGALLRAVDGISQRMLTRTLRELERNGLLRRTVHATVPPRVDYELTDLGASLVVLFGHLCDWSTANMEQVLAARSRFEEAQG